MMETMNPLGWCFTWRRLLGARSSWRVRWGSIRHAHLRGGHRLLHDPGSPYRIPDLWFFSPTEAAGHRRPGYQSVVRHFSRQRWFALAQPVARSVPIQDRHGQQEM